MGNALIEVQKYGQSLWYDNIRRGIITSGQLQHMIDDDGLLGITSNPSIFEKAVVDSTDYDQALRALVTQGCGSAKDIYERLAIEDIQLAADVLHPVFLRTGGRDGFVSFEVSPHLAHDTAGTIEEAHRVHRAIGRQNVLIKVPGTPEGMPAISTLVGEGISVNVTLLFSVDAYANCADAYITGLEKYSAGGRDPGRVASVASFFISRIDTLVDKKLEQAIASATDAAKRSDLEKLQGVIAIANGIIAYDRYQTIIASERWKALARKGARTQRVLWASTSTKNPKYSKTKYVDEMIAPDTVNTIPEETWNAYRELGKPSSALVDNWVTKLAAAKQAMRSLEGGGISMKSVTEELLADGVKKFADAFDALLASVEKKRDLLKAA